ncbi:MAG TPA: hypothetical protein VMG30_07800 [Acidobacteriota bacterium]|nr:hypothetical protein [Acidobacteriota bacterium]
MQFPKIHAHLILGILLVSWSAWAQENTGREVQIHKNVKLIEMPAAADVPEEIAAQHKSFSPIFEQALKQATIDEKDDCALTIRVTLGFKEIGASKTKRPTARVTAFRKGSKQEFVGTLIIYSYANASLVSADETEQFLKKQILEPAACGQQE